MFAGLKDPLVSYHAHAHVVAGLAKVLRKTLFRNIPGRAGFANVVTGLNIVHHHHGFACQVDVINGII